MAVQAVWRQVSAKASRARAEWRSGALRVRGGNRRAREGRLRAVGAGQDGAHGSVRQVLHLLTHVADDEDGRRCEPGLTAPNGTAQSGRRPICVRPGVEEQGQLLEQGSELIPFRFGETLKQ